MEKKFINIWGLPIYALRFADGGGSAGTGGGETGAENNGAGDNGNGDNGAGGDNGGGAAAEKQFTQADIDTAVEKRLTRERKKWEREHPTQTPPAQAAQSNNGAGDGQQQSQQPQKDESAEKIAKVNKRLVATEAKAAAIAAGVKPEKVDYVVKLADLDGVDVDEDDGPDSEAINKAVNKVLKDMPEFKTVPDNGNNSGMGFQVGADGSNQAKKSAQAQNAAQNAPVKRWNRFR
jgi:hypothetical protein